MTDGEAQAREAGHIEGRRRTLIDQISQAIRGLSGTSEVPEVAKLVAERQEAIAVLRRLCAEFGDNSWDDNTHLADVIEKNLFRYVERKRP